MECEIFDLKELVANVVFYDLLLHFSWPFSKQGHFNVASLWLCIPTSFPFEAIVTSFKIIRLQIIRQFASEYKLKLVFYGDFTIFPILKNREIKLIIH